MATMFSLAGEAHAALQCYDCHGTRNTQDVRPEDALSSRNPSSGGFQGNHRTHMGASAVQVTCVKCHPGSDSFTSSHRIGYIKVSSRINNSPQITTYPYSNSTSAWSQTSNPPLGSCNRVNCHFESTTPNWGSPKLASTSDCNTCHGAPPKDGGQHPLKADGITPTKHGSYFGTGLDSCSYCHSDHTMDKFGNVSTIFQHATSAGKRPLIVQFTLKGTTKGSYSGYTASNRRHEYNAYLDSQTSRYSQRNGSCTTLYCHSDGLGNPPTVTPTWSSTSATQCYSCHKGQISDNTQANCIAAGGTWRNVTSAALDRHLVGICTPFLTMTSNGHQRLVGPQWIRQYACTFCHSGTVTSVPQALGQPPKDGAIISAKHVNGAKDIVINPYWSVGGVSKVYSSPRYNQTTKVCSYVYCHSDGTVDPELVKPFAWNRRNDDGSRKHDQCNDCHGHRRNDDGTTTCTNIGCHDNKTKFLINNISTVLTPQTNWPAGEEWKAALPMYANGGLGSTRANSHPQHMQKNISCSECHNHTTPNLVCTSCHSGAPNGGMDSRVSHLDPAYHVNKRRDISFRQNGTFGIGSDNVKSCSSTNGSSCHGNNTIKWGDSADNTICLNCHGNNGTGNSGLDEDRFNFANTTAAKISLPEWFKTGHGRMSSTTIPGQPSGRYPGSNNPAANFPGNPCWYCHDKNVQHLYSSNPFRLKFHTQFGNRFDKECVYCHMQGIVDECLICHNVSNGESLAPQLKNITSSGIRISLWPNYSSIHAPRPDHRSWQYTNGVPSCLSASPQMINGYSTPCHYVDPNNSKQDVRLHNSGAGFWSAGQKLDIRNQYLSMGVCLKCHDDDSNNKCGGCHSATDPQYQLGYDPGTGYIKPKKARASSVHFGYKHYRESTAPGWGGVDANGRAYGTWKGGKFCWDCHDVHGDSNIYMIHDKVSTQTDGRFGIPKAQAKVVFTRNSSGSDYAQKNATTITGICNVCHGVSSGHYRADGGDGHNSSIRCTNCHEHRFTDSHAEGNPCNTCHKSKPVPRHSAFGLPLDCIKCHSGVLNNSRTDIIGQFKGNSHHVQGIPISNRHCYQCHWESTPEGMIDVRYHEGFNFINYTSQSGKKVDLVIYGPGVRPTIYRTVSSASGRATAVTFLASNIGSGDINVERREASNITNHCLGCHSDQNNKTKPFNDCKTPRQYAWDTQSIASRYTEKGTTKWGKYSSTTVNAKYKITKAFSAHGNAGANQGGWNPATGIDSNINNYRPGFTGFTAARKNVQCFDCHNSHGSKGGVGDPNYVSSSYVSYSGLRNGANIKEISSGKGGYKNTYFASGNSSAGVNPYNAGAGQCFDCHVTSMKAADWTNGTPWGYQSTFGATQPIMGYKDTVRFGQGIKASTARVDTGAVNTAWRDSRKNILGGHFKRSTQLTYSTSVNNRINGLCTPCHDPHGVSQSLGANKAYAVPLLKGTWMTSPYKEDQPPLDPSGNHLRKAPYGVATPVTGNYLSWGDGAYHHNHPTPNIPATRHNLDHNTFGGSSRITEDDSKYAGLCTRCHTKERLFGSYAYGTATSANKAPWKSLKRIHAVNKGWGTNKEHSFTCSKCHQPHNSGLPRLMQTNCLDYQHRGGRSSGGMPWSADRQTPGNAHDRGNEHRGYPIGSMYWTFTNWATANDDNSIQYTFAQGTSAVEATTACHIGRNMPVYTNTSSYYSTTHPNTKYGWPDGNSWNTRTPWSQ